METTRPKRNQKYKERRFRLLFSGKKELLELYNALNGRWKRINMEKKISYTAVPEDEMFSLEHILKARMGLSRREISRAKFREQGICVDGERRKVNAPVRAGEYIEVVLEEKGAASGHLEASGGVLSVVYEDADVIVMDKPAGLVTHPTGGYYGDTLANRLAAYLREKEEDSVIRIPGRLDKDTSGLVLAVKNRAAGSRLARQRETGCFYKTYLAVTEGVPGEKRGRIDIPIGSVPGQKGKMRVDLKGKPAFTEYEVVRENGREALVRLRIYTGRTHQIRVHMAALGCPLAGDPLYNPGSAAPIFRTALHAGRLCFRKPFTGEEVAAEAPVPADLHRLLAVCGLL